MRLSNLKKNPFREIWDHPLYNNAYNHNLPGYPLLVDVELTNKCNIICLFCDRQIMEREQGLMSEELFRKIVDDISKNSPFLKAIKFSRWGEPSLHPEFYKFIRIAKEKGLKIHVTSNGLLLNPEKCLNIDSLNISMQGLNKEEYTKIRNNDQYDRLVDNIMQIMAMEERPFVNLSVTVLDETEEEINEFKEKWLTLVDAIGFGQTSFVRVDNQEMLKRQTWEGRAKPCNDVLTRLSVDWDGCITPCCADFDRHLMICNIKDNTIKELWTNKRITEIREIMKNGEWEKMKFCQTCSHRW